MPQILPLQPSNPHYRFGTTLAEEPYLIDIRWNGREGAWYMDILSEDEDRIASGLKLVLGGPIGDLSPSNDFPAGHFYLFDASRTGTEATFEDLGVRVNLYFYTEQDLEEIAAFYA